MSQNNTSFLNKSNTKSEYENFYKINTEDSKREAEEIAKLKKKLREKVKERENTEKQSYQLKNKVNALKTEENRAIKKLEQAKKNLSNIESVRKNMLASKINFEENRYKQDKEFEEKKQKIMNQRNKTLEIVTGWKNSLALKKHDEKMKLISEKRKIMRKINIDRQEEEERNKQLCIKVKNSKINFVDKKQEAIDEKKKKLKKELLEQLKKEELTQQNIEKEKESLAKEENEIKDTLKTIENTNIDERKHFF